MTMAGRVRPFPKRDELALMRHRSPGQRGLLLVTSRPRAPRNARPLQCSRDRGRVEAK